MQKELQALQPKLLETSLETEQLIEVIEHKTEEVEAVKSVVEADEAVAEKAAMEAKAIKVTILPYISVLANPCIVVTKAWTCQLLMSQVSLLRITTIPGETF